jgi:serine protease AprX
LVGSDRIRIRRALRAAVVIVAVAVLMETAWTPIQAASKSVVGKVDPALLADARAHPTSMYDVIVQATTPVAPLLPNAKETGADRAGKALLRAGERPSRALGLISGASARVHGANIVALAADPDVAFVYADVHLVTKFDPRANAALVTEPGQLEVNAPAAWSTYGATGRGVGVAVIDSGIYAHPDLAGRIVASIDFTSAAPQVSPVPLGDPGGHGTHVAGLVAGDGTASGGAYTGVAPQANLIDVRVVNASGASSMSTVLAGLQWVVSHRAAYNIRVANLSLGAPENGSYKLNPLNSAVEVLSFAGITVVVSAGNAGPSCGTITTPGDDPFVITVGALDDNGSATLADDSIGSWSSCGPTAFDGLAKPDLIAPGRRMVSLRSPGSTLDTQFPEREVSTLGASSPQYFVLSGTSMAAPMVAGAAALILEKDPTLTPRQVKQRLLSTATPLPFTTRSRAGAGLLNVFAAVGSSDRTSYATRATVGYAFAQMLPPLIYGKKLTWKDLGFNGGADSRGVAWSNVTWADITWDSITWEDVSWEDITWEDITWEAVTAQDITWEVTFMPLSSDGAGWSPVD